MNAFSSARTLALFAAMLGGATAQAAVVDITWNAEGRFEQRLDVAPGGFAELCGALDKGQAVAWRFDSSAELAFNVHYHLGNDVVYPVKNPGTSRADGRLVVDPSQTYCWMWSNKGKQPVRLQVELKRER